MDNTITEEEGIRMVSRLTQNIPRSVPNRSRPVATLFSRFPFSSYLMPS